MFQICASVSTLPMCVSIIKERFFESSAAGKPPEEVICERLLVDRGNNESLIWVWRLWLVIGRWFGNNESFYRYCWRKWRQCMLDLGGECGRVILNESKEGRTKARIGTKEKMSESKEWLWESMAVDSMESLDSFPYSWYLYPAKMRRKWGWSWAGWVWQ